MRPFEHRILEGLPGVGLAGMATSAGFATWMRLFPPPGSALDVEKHLGLVDAFASGWSVLTCCLVLVLALACNIVIVMKGPVRTSDSYPLPDRDRPLG